MKLLRKQTVSQSGSHETTLRSLSRPKGMQPYPEVFISWLTCFIFAINCWNFNDFKQGEAHSCTSRVADWASKLENLLPKNIQILFCAERLLEWQREFAVKENRLFYFNHTLEKIQSKLHHSCYAPTHLELVQVCFCDERSKTKLVKRLVQLRQKFLKTVPFHLNINTRNGIPEETRTHGNNNCAQREWNTMNYIRITLNCYCLFTLDDAFN